MDLSGNFVAPTLNGEWYLKKPPLWNWILSFSFWAFGKANEFSARFPTVLFLYAFVVHTFLVFRKHASIRIAVFTALAVLTCGRILFWDSMLALIDICFSWLVFAFFTWTYEYHRKSKFLRMYLGGYLLVAMAFMLKGLPALVFLVLTFTIYQWHQGTWKKLFSWQHWAGVSAFVLIVGGYLVLYNHENSIFNLLAVYFDESARRTLAQHSFWESILQWVSFPFEMTYHFLPWSLLALLLISKSGIRHIQSHPFILFCTITFIGNIWVYWLAPEVYPRYLLMFTPLYFGIGFHIYDQMEPNPKKILDYILIAFGVLLAIAAWAPLVREDTQTLPMLTVKTITIAGLLILLSGIMIKSAQNRLLIFFAMLLVVRIGLNWFILPLRATTTEGALVREDAIRIGNNYADQPLYIFADDSLRYENSFYITNARQEILKRSYEQLSGTYLIVNPRKYPDLANKYEPVDSMQVRRIERLAYIIRVPDDE